MVFKKFFDRAIRSTHPVEKVGFLDGMCGSDCSIEKIGIEKALFQLHKNARFRLRSEIALFDPPIRLHKNWPKFLTRQFIGLIYRSNRANRRLGKIEKKRRKHPPQRDDASTVSAATCRVVRGEQGEACPAISTPRGGSHLDLGRLRLQTWSKSDSSIAETWPTYHIFIARMSTDYLKSFA